MKEVRKLIDEHFSQKDSYDDGELEEDSLVKATVNDILEGKVEDISYDGELENTFNVFKSKVFPLDDTLSRKVYAGKTVSRKSLNFESDNLNTTSEASDSDCEKKELLTSSASDNDTSTEEDSIGSIISNSSINTDSFKSNIKSDITKCIKSDKSVKKTVTFSLPNAEKSEEVIESEDSDIDDDISESNDEDHSAVLYSKNIRDESSEFEKGVAVKNQLNLWEILLEYRIMLQKCLVASNKLPKPNNYENVWSQFSSEDKNFMIDCREKVWDSLEKLIQLQNNLRKQCPEYMETINEKQEESKDDEDCGPVKIKRRKLTEYPDILEKQYNNYIPYRNSVIQKWNDRTKIACGKFAKSNFSAFDQPILKQIEQIMSDKHRLIQRTYIKRSQYKIIGENVTDKNQDDSDKKDVNLETDTEIFDDDDFYHKLLRDYIERKTADISDPTQLGRKWIKLQNLRNKMKRKIDTRRTKGRKIKFDVHTKLMNFMAPTVVDRWTDTAINELYNSVFGKNVLIT